MKRGLRIGPRRFVAMIVVAASGLGCGVRDGESESEALGDTGGPLSFEEFLSTASPGPTEDTFIVGGDMAHALPTSHEPETVLALATLAVAARSGLGRADITERVAGLAGADRIRFFDMPRLDISSSEIRRRVAAGKPIRYLVPDAVTSYIHAESLYR